ncbi:MAG: glycoside hydrolase TIM-barrel-like domain-containing protein [Pseudomonadota bacterium]
MSGPGLTSGASWIASAAQHVQDEFLNSLTEGELLALPFLFEFWALDHQLPPEGNWRTWVIMGGRGAGKTRAGAEWVRAQVEGSTPLTEGRSRRIALVGETFDQVREVMIFGDSGILACSPPDRRPDWEAGRKRLVWPNGAVATAHSAFDPEGLRGPQFDAAWVDEYGCAAIDKGTNQPNKFLDPKSSESRVPKFSSGARDDLIQAQYFKAMLSFWNTPENNPTSPAYNGPMVDMSRAYVWAWDARPYPYFPNNADLWTDSDNYSRGHWLNGRTSSRALASVVAEICDRAGLEHYDVSQLYGLVRGYTVNDVAEARASLQPLMLRYAFDAVERNGILVFRMRQARDTVNLDAARLARSTELDATVEQMRKADAEISGRVRLRFLQADANFDALSEEAVIAEDYVHTVSTSEVPLALTRVEGRQTVERWLNEARVARDTIRFALPPSMLHLGAGDVVSIAGDQEEGSALYRFDRVELGALQLAEAVRIDPQVYEPSDMLDEVGRPSRFVAPVPVLPLFLDLPLITGDEMPHAPFLAATAQPWPGSIAVYQSPGESNYSLLSIIATRAVIGVTETALPRASSGRFDNGTPLRVKLFTGGLSSVEEAALLAGANLAAIGDGTPDGWELFQFGSAQLVDVDTYALSRRLRGQLGTDASVPDVWPVNSWFVLMNGLPEQIDLARNLRGVSHSYRIGPARRPLDDPSFTEITESFAGNGLRPYSPVHLEAVRNSAGGFDIRWIRRTRLDGDNWDVFEVPLGEERESYSVRVVKNALVLREILVEGPAWSYTLSEQAADGLTGAFDVEVAQMSAVFGPGPAARLSLSATV